MKRLLDFFSIGIFVFELEGRTVQTDGQTDGRRTGKTCTAAYYDGRTSHALVSLYRPKEVSGSVEYLF